jgi:type I restriction enzyme S subunit
LNKYLPSTQVWAFGSRVKGTSRANSDLDLVVFSTSDQISAVNALKEAFDESSLPFSVDVLIWDQISESFRKNILERYAVLLS